MIYGTTQIDQMHGILKQFNEKYPMIKADSYRQGTTANYERIVRVWRKYMRGASEEFLEDTYQHTTAALESVPTPSAQVIASALDMLSAHYPQAKQTDPNLIVDPSFVSRIDQSGFIAGLYKNNSHAAASIRNTWASSAFRATEERARAKWFELNSLTTRKSRDKSPTPAFTTFI